MPDVRRTRASRVRVVVGKIDIEHGTPHRRLVLPHVLTCSHVLGRRVRGGGGLSRHQLSQRMPRRGFNSSRAPQSPTIRSLYRNSMALLYVQWRWRFQRCPARHVDSRRLHHVVTEDGWLNTTAASSAAAGHPLQCLRRQDKPDHAHTTFYRILPNVTTLCLNSSCIYDWHTHAPPQRD